MWCISENSRKLYVADLANDVHCNFLPEALMNTVSSYEAAYWLERISYNFLICTELTSQMLNKPENGKTGVFRFPYQILGEFRSMFRYIYTGTYWPRKALEDTETSWRFLKPSVVPSVTAKPRFGNWVWLWIGHGYILSEFWSKVALFRFNINLNI